MEQKILSLYKNTTDSFSEKELIKLLKIDDDKTYHRFQTALNSLIDNFQIVQSRKQRYLLAVSVNYYVGKIDIKAAGFGFVDFEKYPSLYIGKRYLKDAINGDIVAVKKKPYLEEAEVIKVIKRKYTHLAGNISVRKNKLIFNSDMDLNGKHILVNNPMNLKISNGDKVILKITNYGHTIQADIKTVLGNKKNPYIDIISVLVLKQIEYEFNSDVLKEVENIKNAVSDKDIKDRLDLTNLLTVTIDGENAKDLDDAISISKEVFGYRLYVHIADVSHYVKKGSAIDKTAYQRSASLYPINFVVPMLPSELSNGICSLLPNQLRLAFSCQIDIDFKGDVLSYRFIPTVIKSDFQLTYELVEKVLFRNFETTEITTEVKNMLEIALELSNIIRQKKLRQGYLEFFSNESNYKLNQKNEIINITPRNNLNSEKIIEDFMILTNEVTAAYLISKEMPGLYRVHEVPEKTKIFETIQMIKLLDNDFDVPKTKNLNKLLQTTLKSFSNNDLRFVVSNLLLRSLPKAYYDENNKGHFGLGLKAYSHFTAPIRRYSDLVLHRYIKDSLNQKEIKGFELDEISKYVSKQERLILEVEREIEAMKKAEYMEKKIGEHFEGIIISFTEFGFFVRLSNSVEGLVHYDRLIDDHYLKSENSLFAIGQNKKNIYQLGQKVKVEVISASKQRRQIDFSLL